MQRSRVLYLLAGVEQHEGAGAVRALGVAALHAQLAEQRRVLVAQALCQARSGDGPRGGAQGTHAGDGDALQRPALDRPVVLAGGADLRQNARRYLKLPGTDDQRQRPKRGQPGGRSLQGGRVPLQGAQVHQHRPAGIRHVRFVHAAEIISGCVSGRARASAWRRPAAPTAATSRPCRRPRGPPPPPAGAKLDSEIELQATRGLHVPGGQPGSAPGAT